MVRGEMEHGFPFENVGNGEKAEKSEANGVVLPSIPSGW